MSDSDEGIRDHLQIKPPPQHRDHRDRSGSSNRDRDRGDRRILGTGPPPGDYQRSSSSGKSHRDSRRYVDEGQGRDRRREGGNQQPPIYNRLGPPPGIAPDHQRHHHRSRHPPGQGQGQPQKERTLRNPDGTSRHHKRDRASASGPGAEEFEYRHHKSRNDDYNKDQLVRSEQRRKELEIEEERMLRDIRKRHRAERKETEREHKKHSSTEGAGSSKKRRHEENESASSITTTTMEVDEPSTTTSDENVKQRLEKQTDNPNFLPVVEEIEPSSSEDEQEEGEKFLAGSELKDNEAGKLSHSDVSSDEEAEVSQSRKSSRGNSDVSSERSRERSRSHSTGSSKSGSDSNSSSDSDSSNQGDSDDERRRQKKNGGNKLENGKKSKQSSPNQGSEVEVIEQPPKKEQEPNKVDESMLTDVDRAIREINLLPPFFPAVQGCRRVEEFALLNRIEEGTYGVVYRAKDKRTNEIVALKRLKMEKERDGFPITSLREINTLLKAQHENIVTVREIVVGSNIDKIFLVMDYVEHDLKSLMETLKQKDQVFIMPEVKCLMIQLLRAVAHLHDNWILHRDLKTSNLLLSHKGILKVGDFGLAREYGSPLKNYTPIVVTLWYRAPELLLGTKEYSTPIDVWSVGCIFGELLKMEPMFPGKSEANELMLIFQTLGTPNDKIWPGYSKLPLLSKMTFVDQPVNKLKTRFAITNNGIDLLNKFLTYNPAKRITADDALKHQFFTDAPLPIDPSLFPTWPAKSELGHRKASSPKPPSGGRQFKDLKEDDDGAGFFLGIGDRRPPIGAGFSLKF